MKEKYKFGFNLEEDLKALYGDNYESINKKRVELFVRLDNEPLEIRQLRNIIQNPVPITHEELKEWLEIKRKTLEKYSVKHETILTFKKIEVFVMTHHILKAYS